MIRLSSVAFCAACVASPASAVLIRPDRDDAEYLELASRYTASIALTAPASEAVLVAPRWLLVPASRRTDGRARGAINTVARAAPFTVSLPVKPLEDASDLLGVLVPGEEGAAAYVENDEGLYLAGVYCGDDAGGNLFARVSRFAAWIDSVVAPAK